MKPKESPAFLRIINAVYVGATRECESNDLAREVMRNPRHVAKLIANRVMSNLETNYKDITEVLLETRKAAFFELRKLGVKPAVTPSMSRSEINSRRIAKTSRTMWIADRIATSVHSVLVQILSEPEPTPASIKQPSKHRPQWKSSKLWRATFRRSSVK